MDKRVLIASFLASFLLTTDSINAFQKLSQASTYLSTSSKREIDTTELKRTMNALVERRENFGYAGRFVMKMTPYPQTRFVIWGPLKGSFDSLVRAFTFLKDQKIISDDLKILPADVYFLFCGDVINSSNQTLETLALVISFMYANPNKVIYIKGVAEDFLRWQNGGLKKELLEKAKKDSSERVPLGGLITRFFETLPLAFYISGNDPLNGLIRISAYSSEQKELDETLCGSLLLSSTLNVPEICSLAKGSRANVSLKALIKSENRLISYRHHNGLALVSPERGAISWSIFSAPTKKFQEEYEFFYDAFSILTTGNTLADAWIAIYNRDVRSLDDITRSNMFNLLTGTKLTSEPTVKKDSDTLEGIQKQLKNINAQINDLISQTSQLKLNITTSKPRENT